MTEIPVNENDNKKMRMERFVNFALMEIASSPYHSVTIYDYSEGNEEKVPGITEAEARELASMFVAKGYHSKAYYIDFPRHGFRSVTICSEVLASHSARCAHSEVWG